MVGSSESQTISNRRTRDAFIWCMTAIYLFAFGSLYHQIPGLYGDNGILPVRSLLKPADVSMEKNFSTRPTLVWLAPLLGLDFQLMTEFVALSGLVLSTLCLLSRRLRNPLLFAALWILYMSLYQIGQTFTSFQWDILLLEAGFLCILVAPLNFFRSKATGQQECDTISLWLVRWLLFRLMFASGVVKLTSLCPTWWQLSALSHHFESQCLPTPLAWYAHHLPGWLLKLGTVGTYLIEIAIPFLFFAPIRSLRLFAFYAQLLLQLAIIATGNYTFFNLLTVVLCLSLLDDKHLGYEALPVAGSKKKKAVSSGGESGAVKLLTKTTTLVVFSMLAYLAIALFSIKLNPNFTVESKIAFTSKEFHRALEKGVRGSIYLASASLALTLLTALHATVNSNRKTLFKLGASVKFVFYASVATWLFCISMVPHTVVDKDVHAGLWPVVRKWHDNVDRYNLVNSYGLFRRMTGVGGRPEVVIEGSNSIDSGWKEYHFQYKPGNLSGVLPVVAPHQPRLDWQMWFAALGSYQQNPWFVSLINRLLSGQKEVLSLLDIKRNPFPNHPPKYIRAINYLYQYTPAGRRSADWWTRQKVGEYLPVISKDHPSLKEYLLAHNLAMSGKDSTVSKPTTLHLIIKTARDWIGPMSAALFLASLFLSVCIVNLVGGSSSSQGSKSSKR